MIREERFVQSHAPYAVDLASLRLGPSGLPSHGHIDAVWFRRRKGQTVACIGYLWDYQDETVTTPLRFLAQHEDGRYGGHTSGRWNGSGYWGVEDPEEVARHLATLRPMLANFPAVPPGYDEWWTFKTAV